MKAPYKRTQATAVLEWLRSGKPLTRLQGFLSLYIADLTKVIGKLRKQGFIIHTEMISHKGRYGSTKYAKYHLIADAPEPDGLEAMCKSVKRQLDTVKRRPISKDPKVDTLQADLDAIDRQLDVMERLMKDNPVIDITERLDDATD